MNIKLITRICWSYLRIRYYRLQIWNYRRQMTPYEIRLVEARIAENEDKS